MLFNIRHIDLYDFMKLTNGALITNKGRILLPEIGITESSDLQSKEEYYNMHYANIYYILQQYPGLFEYIYIDYYKTLLSMIYINAFNVGCPFLDVYQKTPYNIIIGV